MSTIRRRSPLRVSRRSVIAALLGPAFALSAGCDVFINIFPGLLNNRETGNAELKRFASEQEFTDYVRTEITRRNSSVVGFDRVALEGGFGAAEDVVDLPSTGASPSAPGGNLSADGDGSTQDFSGTTIQEVGVDEADVVKTDGNYLYILSPGDTGAVLRIVDVSQRAAMSVVSETVLTGHGRDLYLYGDTVVALTNTGGGYFYFGGGGIAIDGVPAPAAGGDFGVDVAQSEDASGGESEPGFDPDAPADSDEDSTTDIDVGITPNPDFEYRRPATVLTVIDVTQRDTPVVVSETSFDGYQSSSRMIDGVLHLVLANYQSYYVDVFPLLGQPEFDGDTIDPEVLLPRYTRIEADGTETSRDVLTWRELYRPTDSDGFGVVYVASVDIDADASFTAIGIVAEPGLIYSSREALYLTDTNWDFSGNLRNTTDFYKFDYVGRGTAAVAAGTVPGRVLNQYSMGEHDGYLRVATTVRTMSGMFGQRTTVSNSVYVLGQTETTLGVVGSVTGIAPEETVQATRFIGLRGFVVTFEEIDPLFTLDLSDPTDPRVIGKLEVPGFSTYIVPIDDDHLLTVGQYIPPPGEFGPSGVQLSIYDISDFSQPQVMDNVIIGGDTGAYSEALSDPKAFTYFAERGLVALPLTTNGAPIFIEDPLVDFDETGGSDDETPAPPPDDPVTTADDPIDSGGAPFEFDNFKGVAVYSVSVDDGFTEMGRVSARFDKAGYYWASFTRGVFIGDDVLAVTNHGVRAASVDAIETTQTELVFDAGDDAVADDATDGGNTR